MCHRRGTWHRCESGSTEAPGRRRRRYGYQPRTLRRKPYSTKAASKSKQPIRQIENPDLFFSPDFAPGESSIEGAVTDSSGGGIPGVSVQIKNLETGAERLLTTDDSGRFSAAALSVGQYQVRAEKSGFRAEIKNGISLVVGQRLFVDLVLQIGDVRQVVEVPSVPTVVAVTTDDSSGLVGERQ